MFERTRDEIAALIGAELRRVALAAVAALLAAVGVIFLGVAGFIALCRLYGPIIASLAGAAVFLVAALVVVLVIARERARARLERALAREQRAKEATERRRDPLGDPALVANVARMLRAADMVPLLPLFVAIGAGLALRMRRRRRGRDLAAGTGGNGDESA